MEVRRCLACGADVVGPDTHECATSPDPGLATPSSAFAPRTGEVVLDRWDLVEKIAEGGGGMVFHARDRELGVDVALKILPPGQASDTAIKRLKREIRITREIDHPNVSRVFDLGTWRGLAFYTMRLVGGESLYRRVQRDGALRPAALVRLVRGLLDALAAAHRLGVVHRDVKPGNVLVARDGTPVLVDFGIARDEGGSARTPGGDRLTPVGLTVGTPSYMAPEVNRGETATPASDMYAFALTISFAATRRVGKPDDPASAFGTLPSALRAMLVRCLSAEPSARPPSAVAVLGELERTSRRTRNARITAVVTVGVAAIVGATWTATREEPGARGPPVVLVEPVDNRTGDPALDWLEHGAADLLTASFEAAGGARIAIAQVAGAHTSSGSVRRSGEEVVVDLRLADADGDEVARASLSEIDGERLFRDVDDVARRFLRAMGARPTAPRSARPPVVRDPEAWRRWAIARDLVRRHQDAAALEELRRAISIDPTFALAHLEMHVVMTYWVLGSRAEADAALARAREHRDRLPPSRREFLDAILDARGDGPSPAKYQRLRAFLRSHPPESSTYQTAFRTYFSTREDRLSLLREWAERIPHDPEVHNQLGYLMWRDVEDLQAAEREFREGVRLDPGNPNGHDSIGEFLRDQGRLDEAIASYDRALAIDPGFGFALVGAIDATLRRDDLADASRRIDAGGARLDVRTSQYAVWVRALAAVHVLRGGPDAGIRRLEEVASEPRSGGRASVAREVQAILRALAGDAAGARAAATEADRLDRAYHGEGGGLPTLVPYVEGLSAFRRGDPEAMERAVPQIPPGDDRHKVLVGLALAARGEASMAAERLASVTRDTTQGTTFLALLERARALLAAGRVPEADAAYAEAIAWRARSVVHPEPAALWRTCLREAADLARRLGDGARAGSLEGRLAALSRAGTGG